MKTFKIVFITLLILRPAIFLFAQNGNDLNKINFIKAHVSVINNNISAYKKVMRNDDGQSTEGGGATGYFKNNEITKITAIYYGETGKTSEEYYFADKRLIFFYSLTKRYKKPFYINPQKIEIASTSEVRYYFDSGTIIKYIIAPVTKMAGKKLVNAATDIQKDANRLLSLINSPASDN